LQEKFHFFFAAPSAWKNALNLALDKAGKLRYNVLEAK